MKNACHRIARLLLAAGLGAGLALALALGFTRAQAQDPGTVDLTVVHATTRDHVAPGAEYVVNILYENHGDAAAPGARLTVTLPAAASFVSAADPQGAPMPPDFVDGDMLAWDLGDLPAFSCCNHLLVTQRADDDAPEGDVLTTTATIASQAAEAVLGNNTAQAGSVVCDMAGSTKQASAGQAMPGDVVTYTIALRLAHRQGEPMNREREISLTDALPAEHQAAFLGWTGEVSGGHQGQALQWQGRVRAGQPVTLQYRLGVRGDVTPGLVLTNAARLEWGGGQLRLGPVTTVVTLPHHAYAFGPGGGEWRHGDGVSLTVPPGAVSDTTRFEYRQLFTGTQPISGPPGLKYAHRAFELTAYRFGQEVRQFGQPLTITVPYSDADVAGMNRETLRLWHREGPGQPWAQLGEPARVMSGALAFTTTHFTEFALFGRPACEVWLPIVER
jgi:hypothetical protein